MKKLNALNLGKGLNREEMRAISGGIDFESGGYCTCGTKPAVLTRCGCVAFCNDSCKDKVD
ncbi:hypothetical protein SGQ83_00570 [Flavobacterium sp. Fl-318]|uniref:Bacteriocin n=1 Tax=Flavobacterium cupriresistens TaxID=2893885 RepID=A0ABU4R8Q6_9FLAO|nr:MULTISPECIES: hypothetical protein [unclassified Flavobacterium]MDX6187830.1 hypothetical protein [Flavobacterium sp. Fl-318]UFH42248.1 hypothetical protein LNP23_20880 [Flavobacterium sp. F-323]